MRPRFSLRRPSPAMVVSTMALAIAATSGAVAAATINGADIIPGTIGTIRLHNQAVTAAKIAPNAVGTSQLASRAVTGAKIAPNAVGQSQLATGSVTSRQIAPGAVVGGDIRAGAVSGSDIGTGTITRSNLGASARVPTTVTRYSNTLVPINTSGSVSAVCAPGETVVAGGFSGLPTTTQAGGTQATVLASRPDPIGQGATPTGWFVSVENLSTTLANVTAYVVCATPN